MELVKPHVSALEKYGTSYALERAKAIAGVGLLKENYINVKDVKSNERDLVVQKLLGEIDLIRNAMNAAIGTKPLKIHLWMEDAKTSSATTAQAPVQRCRPSDSAEFSALASLFDEYKMISAVNHFKIFQSTGTAGGVDAGVAYDPVDGTAYGGLITLLPAAQKMGPIATGAIGATAPQTVNETGHFKMPIHCPEGPQLLVASAASPAATGTWQDCTITAADYGYFKYYVTAPSSGTSSVSWHVEMNCLFRSRT